jgi:hypothetical protein
MSTAQMKQPTIVNEARRHQPSYLSRRLERLRDEVRLDMHLARMDARDQWKKLEPQLVQAEKLAEHVTEISFRAMGQIAAEVKRFQDHLKQHRPRA